MHLINDESYCIENTTTKEELLSLANNLKITHIEIRSDKINSSIFELLNDQVLVRRPEIHFWILAGTRRCDLSFLSKLSDLKNLHIRCVEVKNQETISNLSKLKFLEVDIFGMDSFDFLSYLSNQIVTLFLGPTNSKKPNLRFLETFRNLRDLQIDGHNKNIEVISKLLEIQNLTLRSITSLDISFLEELKNLNIKLGGISDLSAISGMKRIQYLELWQIRKLEDIGVISSLQGLREFFLQSLPNVSKIPSLEKSENLKTIRLENMKGLKDFKFLSDAPALEKFIFVDSNSQDPKDLLPLFKNKSLKEARVGFGSDKKNKVFRDYLNQYNLIECW
ncbi:hypothetical protein RBB68_10125 [Leptospira interrogans]|uniref:Leucine rich repeat protein n=8 Tax=Leptospira interrogans TaxID=173 RepID=M6RRD7_LEPIR|nr:hypothetical protein [Leptospira interrogans]APH41865.1 Uncharacterized protein A9P81_2183 [Leptospira interrogans serovar Copenhageni/Icterohaemorrhagiae]EMG21444.1 hypothetical protein LEP1GSC150_1454 [Leptospira interrogans serovar Copenhageni str. LT2050]EMO07094.1 hypothetical protein LEP1GSC116_3189 [Leptospira interrogans serovar Icterohaemorrhagiae str. Verdun HP]AAS70598.1 conserved hypothetical protein [Leptospira interrogans serovar Copenhageni str. Fiocruz L1-130]EKP22152.1 hypo